MTGTPVDVVPLVGTWIEMDMDEGRRLLGDVVPLVGTWIEITSRRRNSEKN